MEWRVEKIRENEAKEKRRAEWRSREAPSCGCDRAAKKGLVRESLCS